MWNQNCCESAAEDGHVVSSGGDDASGPLEEPEESVTSETPAAGPTRFPKMTNSDVRKMENHGSRPPSASQRVGLPQMHSNMMRLSTPPCSQTIQHYQGEADTLPTVWEERFSFGDEAGDVPHGGLQGQRSRSFYQASHQGQDSNQELHYDASYAPLYQNQRPPKARTSQWNSFNPSYRSQFQQPEQFRGLPLQIYRRLCEEISGMVITDYFGTAVTVARLQNDNIMEFGMCHVIFAINSGTDQYWLKAFTKKTRSQEGNVMKFSRLLTANISLEFCGKTAVLIGPSNGQASLPSRTAEKHMFNFFEENEATRFIDALDKGKNQVWNHSELRRKSHLDHGGANHSQVRHDTTYEATSRPGSRNRPTNATSVNERNSRPNSRLDQDHYSDSQRGSSATGRYYELYAAAGLDQFSNIRFRAPGVQVFVKVRTAYTLLGMGEIFIVDTAEGYDNLVFIATQAQVLCNHLIYSWNQPTVFQQNGSWECTWAAAANLLININPRQMPSIREFKLAGSQDVVLKFLEALQQSASRALTKRNTTASANHENSTEQRVVPETMVKEKQGKSESDQQ